MRQNISRGSVPTSSIAAACSHRTSARAELSFRCLGARAEPHAAAPTLGFTLRIDEHTGRAVHAIALRVQLRLQPQARGYSAVEEERLLDLFGDRSRWCDTLKAIRLTNVTAMVSSFRDSIDVGLLVPCTYGLEVACGGYFAALEDGEISLLMLFSGTVFARQGDAFAVDQVPWSSEVMYRLPVSVWRSLVDLDFPDSGWLRLSRDSLDALGRYKSRHALLTWDSTLHDLLLAQDELLVDAERESLP